MLSFLAVFGLVAVVRAHVTVVPDTIDPAGGYWRVALRVPHGCHAEGDTGVSYAMMKFDVNVPQPVANASTARPEMIPYWKNTIKDELDGSRTLTWTAVSPEYYLSNDYFMEFGVSMKVPAGAEGGVLYFPATQYCTNSTVAAWVNVTAGADKPSPTIAYQACKCSAGNARDVITPFSDNSTAPTKNTTTSGSAPLWSAWALVFCGMQAVAALL